MKFINKKPEIKSTNYELIKMQIPELIRNKITTYTPTNDLKEIKFIEFKSDLTLSQKQQLLSLFPELKEVI